MKHAILRYILSADKANENVNPYQLYLGETSGASVPCISMEKETDFL